MGKSCVQNDIHLIFATKNRINSIVTAVESRLYCYLGGIAKGSNSPILIVNGTQNHIHVLLRLHPSIALATLVKELKSYSTQWMKKQGHKSFAWQIGYGAFSVSLSALEKVRKYIELQKIHHQEFGFKAEIDQLISRGRLRWSFLEDEMG
ncbi:hypothetical protein SCG7109_AI_00010 [Chlamydiales bacterium SCGC AG-110-M15]|nr:hypothetical protein SCG7109_AI_00010 [Chlamydiales bacterium SCGC AG-110-M15]